MFSKVGLLSISNKSSSKKWISVHKELLNGVFNSSALRALSIFLSKGHICGSRGTELDILPPQQPMLLLSIQ